MLTLSQMRNHTYTCNFAHAFTHSPMHSLTQLSIHSHTHFLTHSLAHIFSLSLNLILSLLVTSMLIQANSILLMHILTLTHNYMYTRTDSIMRSYNACTHALTYTQSVCACVILGTRVCTLACVIKQMM